MNNPFKRNKKQQRRKPMSLFKAGIIGIVAVSVFTYLAFTKFQIPFAPKYTVTATFASANGVHPETQVRIAGVTVGKVDQVQPVQGCQEKGTSAVGCQAVQVTMEFQPVGRPLHKDATFALRPRTFLEGNFFIDVHPGTPESQIAPADYTYPAQQAVAPVQFDQILSSLPYNTRENLQVLVQQLGTGLRIGAPFYNRSIQYWLPAYRDTSMVSHDFLGIQSHDLSNALYRQGTVNGAFDMHPPNLKSLITDFNTTANAFARQNVALQLAVQELPRTLSTAIPAFNSLNAAFPPLRQLARALVPGVRSGGPAIDVSLPFVTQLRKLVQPAELRGLTADLAVTVPNLARLARETIPLMRDQVRPASSCVSNDIIPWSHLTLQDPNFGPANGFPNREVHVEAVDFLPGLAGESRVFDADGPVVRITATSGTFTYSLSPKAFGQSLLPLAGAQPAPPTGSRIPPLQPNVPCETQPAINNLQARQISLSPVAASNGGILTGILSGLHLPPGALGLARDQNKAKKTVPAKPTTKTTKTTRTTSTTTAQRKTTLAGTPTGAGKTR